MRTKCYEKPESELILVGLEGNFLNSDFKTGEAFDPQTGYDDDDDWE